MVKIISDELQEKLNEAFKKDKSHTKELI